MQKTVLVTGCAGLVGSHLCDALVEQNYQVTGVDNFITGRKDNLVQLLDNSNFTFIEADVSLPPNSYKLKAMSFDFIFHLASPASPKGYLENPVDTYKVNAFGTHHLLEFVKATGARFLYSSTSESYGDPDLAHHPQQEDYWGNVNPVGVRACYDESKRFGEMVCSTFHREYGVDTRVVRIFNTYGPRNDPNDGRVVPSFIFNAIQNRPIVIYGDGSQTRSFCYVHDLIEGLLAMMMSDNLAGQIINLGNPDEFTILELAKKVIALTGSKSTIEYKPIKGNRDDDPQRRRPDITKAKQVLNWQPKIPLEKGLVPTIEYFKSLL